MLVISLIFRWQPFQTLLAQTHHLGYLGAFIGGILFVFTFTVAFGGVILFNLIDSYSLISIALVAGLGGVIGDIFIFKFIKAGITEELKPLYRSLGGNKLTKLLHTAHYKWTLPVIGALIIASPFPDEIGVAMMGLSKIRTSYFMMISFVLNVLGLFLLLGGLMMFKEVVG